MMADAMMTFPGEGFKRPWLPLIRMSEEVRRKIEAARNSHKVRHAQRFRFTGFGFSRVWNPLPGGLA